AALSSQGFALPFIGTGHASFASTGVLTPANNNARITEPVRIPSPFRLSDRDSARTGHKLVRTTDLNWASLNQDDRDRASKCSAPLAKDVRLEFSGCPSHSTFRA